MLVDNGVHCMDMFPGLQIFIIYSQCLESPLKKNGQINLNSYYAWMIVRTLATNLIY